jgi:hypothetical protein
MDNMSGKRKNGLSVKEAIGFAIAVLALIGGIAASFLIGGEKKVEEEKSAENVVEVEKDAAAEEELANYDTTELKKHTDKARGVFSELSDYLDATYGKKAERYDLSGDAAAQVLVREFVAAADEFGKVIEGSPYSDLKTEWQGFRKTFDKRREVIEKGMTMDEDGGWMIDFVGVYLLAASKVSEKSE